MRKSSITYRICIAGFLSLLLTGILPVKAGDNQNMTSLTALSHGSGLGDTHSSSAYNPDANEYLVVYAKNDGTCSNERLFGIIINAVTGAASGLEFAISDCNVGIKIPEVVYNSQQKEYLVFYKSIGTIGNKSSIYYSTVDAVNYEVSLSPAKLAGDVIADPFQDLTISYDKQSGIYAMGYHKVNASGEATITINYFDAREKVLQGYSTTLDKTTFADTNKGPFDTKIIFNGSNISCLFELRLDTGGEIWGGNFNSANGTLINDFYQVSPNGAADLYYTNPAAIYNASAGEVITVYEESYYSDTEGAYILSSNIRLQKINAQNGTLTGQINKALPPLPGTGNTEDKKQPAILSSTLSNEIIISYYGIRFAAGTDTYNLYLHRLDLSDLSSISSSSITVSSSVGKQVLQNTYSKPLGFSYNTLNNQYLLSWIVESNDELISQVWRYDNNPPSNLQISSTEQNENMPVGSTFATFSADDPDPEDASPTYALVDGIGGEDKAYFTIAGNELKIAILLNYEESPTRSIKVRATDSHGAYTDRVIALTIRDVNDPPANIELDAQLRIEENNSSFTAPVVVYDEDLNDTHLLSLIQGDSSDNNVNFEIVNNQLILKSSLNYEDTSMQYVRIRATDIQGATKYKAFAIQVDDINEPIDSIYLAEEFLPENDPDTYASIIIVDPDEISDYTITLTAGEGDDDNAFFTPEDNKLTPKEPFNFEEKNTYKVRILAKEGTYSQTQQLVIKVSDVNDRPDSITLSSNIIMDGKGAGFSIGKFFSYDQDDGDEHMLTLLEGKDIFIASNDSLYTKIPLIYDYLVPANNFHTIRVRSEDNGGLSIEQGFTIEVVPFSDTEPPQIYNFDKNPGFISDSESELPLSVSVTDNEKLGVVQFYYRSIRSEGDFIELNGELIETDGNEKFQIVNVALDTAELDELGVEYYFKATDAADNADSTEIGYTYVEYQKMPFSPMSETFKGDLSSYKIISNPYVLESNKVSEIFSDYGLSSNEKWVLYEFRNGKNEPIGASSANMQFGKGYWFNKMPDVSGGIVFENAKSPAHNRKEPFEMNLTRGWNLIGNPYPFALDWENVLLTNGLDADEIPLYIYSSEYDVKDELKIFEGGFVFVETNTQLRVPVLGNSGSKRIAKNAPHVYEWIVNFSLDNGKVRNQLAGIGMHEEANDSFDKFDTPLLPRLFTYSDISFDHQEHIAQAFTKDIAPVRENNIWEFIASSNSSDRNFNLSWNKPEFSNPKKRLILYDMINDIRIDMGRTIEYQINLDQEVPFKAIYGDQGFIDEMLSEIRIEALNPYPNPFKDELTMPLILPRSNHAYEVDCSVYNLLGEKVFTTSEEKVGHGIHHIKWLESSDIKQGIYIYSIKVRNRYLTKEFHGRMVKN